MTDTTKTKRCRRCNESKELAAFYLVTPSAVGVKPYYLSRCKECEKANQRARYRSAKVQPQQGHAAGAS